MITPPSPTALLSHLLTPAYYLANACLRRDPAAFKKMQALSGTVLAMQITQPNLTLFLAIEKNGMRLWATASPPPEEAPTPTVQITCRAAALCRYLMRYPLSRSAAFASFKKDMHYAGDLHTAQALLHFLSYWEIDWEGILADYTGDTLAHHTLRLMQRARTFCTYTIKQMGQHTCDYVQEEARLTPTRSEMADFSDGVNALRDQLARCEAHLHRQMNTDKDDPQ